MTRPFLRLATFASMFVLLLPVPASAAQILYELVGDDELSFTLNSTPSPDALQPDGFVIRSVEMAFNGERLIGDIGFVESLQKGGMIIFGLDLNLTGPQLFSGTFDKPMLRTGSFDLAAFDDPDRRYTLSARLNSAPAVPEPPMWIMLLMGFASVGAALRNRRFRWLSFSKAASVP